MAVFRVEKSKHYTSMSNYHLKDKRLSLKAKGLLSVMLSLPEEWDYSVRGLEKICLESKNTINSILNEIERYGYLRRKRIYENGKITNWEYLIFEKSQNEDDLHPKNEDIENQDIENWDNNKILNNKILNNNKKEIIKEKKEKRYFENDNLNDLFKDFLSMRKKIKAVNSDRAITLLMNKLSKYDDKTKTKMIENSIENSWKGIYELKEDNKQTFKHYKSKYEKEEEAMRRFLEADDD